MPVLVYRCGSVANEFVTLIISYYIVAKICVNVCERHKNYPSISHRKHGNLILI